MYSIIKDQQSSASSSSSSSSSSCRTILRRDSTSVDFFNMKREEVVKHFGVAIPQCVIQVAETKLSDGKSLSIVARYLLKEILGEDGLATQSVRGTHGYKKVDQNLLNCVEAFVNTARMSGEDIDIQQLFGALATETRAKLKRKEPNAEAHPRTRAPPAKTAPKPLFSLSKLRARIVKHGSVPVFPESRKKPEEAARALAGARKRMHREENREQMPPKKKQLVDSEPSTSLELCAPTISEAMLSPMFMTNTYKDLDDAGLLLFIE